MAMRSVDELDIGKAPISLTELESQLWQAANILTSWTMENQGKIWGRFEGLL
jgi:hypothetical protein